MNLHKYILTVLCACAFAIASNGQIVLSTGATNQLTYQRGGYGADSVLAIPVKDTIYNGFPSYRLRGRLTLRPQDSVIYYHTGSYWKAVGTGTGGGGTYTEGYGINFIGNRIDVDTAEIATQYDLTQLPAGDTGFVRSVTASNGVINSGTGKYVNVILDTNLAATQYDISGKVNYSDTAAMLIPYMNFGDTAGIIATKYDISNFVPYTGAIKNVDLGAHSIKATRANLDTLEPNSSAGLHIHNASHQDIMIAGAGGGQNLTVYAPTNFDLLKNLSEIDTVLTTSSSGTIKKVGLTPYLKKSDSTLYATQYDISGFIPYSDTSTKIDTRYHTNATYLKITDTANKWVYKVDGGYGIDVGGTSQQPMVYADTNEVATTYDIRKLTNAVLADTVNNVQAVSGIIRFVRSGGTNTVTLLTDGDHKPINVDSIWISGNDIIVRFKETCTQIYDFVIGNDETTQGIHTGQGTINNITGAYTMGATVLLNQATIRVSKPAKLTAAFTYNGTSWGVAAQPSTSPFSWTSPALTITYSSGRVRINTASSFEVTGSPIAICQPANGDANLMYSVSCEYLSPTQSDFYFHNAMGKLTASTPPTGLAFVVDFGVATVRVNPSTEDFGSAGNFWFTGKVKIIK